MEGKWPIPMAEFEGLFVGFETYGPFRARAACSRSIEYSVYIHHDHHGKSIGNQLMVKLIRTAKTDNFHTMIAGIDSSNMESVEFNGKFGFGEVGTFREVGFKFDRWLNVVFMQPIL
jgi:phosphinothricin acetyltransferase